MAFTHCLYLFSLKRGLICVTNETNSYLITNSLIDWCVHYSLDSLQVIRITINDGWHCKNCSDDCHFIFCNMIISCEGSKLPESRNSIQNNLPPVDAIDVTQRNWWSCGLLQIPEAFPDWLSCCYLECGCSVLYMSMLWQISLTSCTFTLVKYQILLCHDDKAWINCCSHWGVVSVRVCLNNNLPPHR